MSRKSITDDLSLTGSQISARSVNRPLSGKSSQRPSSSRGKSAKKTVNGCMSDGGDPAAKPRQGPQTGRHLSENLRCDADRVPIHSGRNTSARDEFLAFFETGAQPKIMKPNARQKSSPQTRKNAWKSPHPSSRSATSQADNNAVMSPQPAAYSIFQPNNARSSSTLDDDDAESARVIHRSLSSEHFFNTISTDNLENGLNTQSKNQPKLQNFNSIANNMTSHAMSPRVKTSLSDMENSFQNIKHKTPVNQVGHSPAVTKGRYMTDDYVKTVNMAACKIQHWFRRINKRRTHGEAAVRRLLDQKRQEKEVQLLQEQERYKNMEQNRTEERKKIREEKAREARQQAIQELQKKRQEKREENARIAEEEVAHLQASGKVTKNKTKGGTKRKILTKTRPRNQRGDSSSDGEGNSDPRPATASTTGRKIDDLFQESLSPNQMADDQESLPNPSQAESKTTLNDLMDTLKLLEEEEKFPTPRNENRKSASLDFDFGPGDSQRHYLPTGEVDKVHKDSVKQSGMLTDDKLQSIISFLDEVEKAERLDSIDQDFTKHNDDLERPALLVPSVGELEQMEQAAATASEVTNAVLSQRLQLDEKARSIQILQKALNQQRELTVRHARETEKEMKKRLDVQKDEYEETIKRHLSFIDQLIDDKKALEEKCETLVKELKLMDKKFGDRLKSMQDNHELELKKVKDVQAAAEKLRREKWIDEKTKKIKEMTVKGLEPEIQRLIAKHKSEIKKIKAIHDAELLESDERAGQRYIKLTEELRDQLAKEKEAACSRERELARQTYEKQMQQEEEAYQQQRRRLFAEVSEEKERLTQQASRQRAELDRLQRQLEDTHGHSVEVMRQEYEKAREEQERRHNTEIRQQKEQIAAEKEAWEQNYLKKEEAYLAQKERELKEQVRRERDKEIELVIGRLEEDSAMARQECERVAENRIKRLRDKYEAEIVELERSERQITEKYSEMKGQMADVEGQNERLKVQLKQKDEEVADIKKRSEKLNKERDYVADVVRQEFADRIVATDEENKRLKTEMSEMKARHRLEIERMKSEIEVVNKAKEEEMAEVHKRVKEAIVKKEDTVSQLRQQYQAAIKRADHLEDLLEQQRKQLLSKK